MRHHNLRTCRIAMCLFDTVQEVKKAYDCYSTFKINLPTPIMAGVRTNIRQFASCVLVDVDDNLDAIFSSAFMLWASILRDVRESDSISEE